MGFSMLISFLWDFDDDPDGNVQHLAQHGITQDEFEEVVMNDWPPSATSRSSGEPMSFGWTVTGKYLACVYEAVEQNPPAVRPITAFESKPPGGMP